MSRTCESAGGAGKLEGRDQLGEGPRKKADGGLAVSRPDSAPSHGTFSFFFLKGFIYY